MGRYDEQAYDDALTRISDLVDSWEESEGVSHGTYMAGLGIIACLAEVRLARDLRPQGLDTERLARFIALADRMAASLRYVGEVMGVDKKGAEFTDLANEYDDFKGGGGGADYEGESSTPDV